MSPRARGGQRSTRRAERLRGRECASGPRAFRIACVLLVAVAAALGSVPATVAVDEPSSDGRSANASSEPRIVAAFPDPVADGDAGEFVLVDAAGAENLTLSDGESTVRVPPGGVVALSATPNATRRLVEAPVVEADLYLSNAGERLVLRRHVRGESGVVHSLEYDRAREGERLNATTGTWTPRGLTRRPVVATGSARATAFVLPDAPDVPRETIRSADDRLLLAGYTFASPRATDALLAAEERGVRVRVLVDGGPVGGMTTAQREQLDRLVAGGVDVRAIAGPHARFAFHHPKYLVADDEALVLTENWKPSGTGGRSNRGWGVRVRSAATADELAAVFAHDADGIDAVPWRERRRNVSFVEEEPATGSYEPEFDPETVEVEAVRVLTAPGNAGPAVRASIADADESVDVISPRLDPDGPHFAALVAAAERGVRVRVLLSNAWYDEESNRAVVARTERLRERGLPIEARVASGTRFGKVHAKGAVIDGETAIVGSLNWNEHAESENREVVLALDGAEPAAYYGEAFAADWEASSESDGWGRGGVDRKVRVTTALGALAAVALAAFVLRRTVEFE